MDKDAIKAQINALLLTRDGQPSLSAVAVDSYLEMARYEYGKYRPSPRVVNTIIHSYRPYIETTEEIVAVLGVYTNSDPHGYAYPFPVFPSIYGNNIDPTLTYSMDFTDGSSPALSYINSYYREKMSEECDYMQMGKRIIPTLYMTPARVVAVYGVVPSWAEIPEQDVGLFHSFVLGSSMRDGLASMSGVVTIPTPVGAFEFDAGKNSQTASKNLLDRFYQELGSSVSYVTSG